MGLRARRIGTIFSEFDGLGGPSYTLGSRSYSDCQLSTNWKTWTQVTDRSSRPPI
jgi:hypothetical protein